MIVVPSPRESRTGQQEQLRLIQHPSAEREREGKYIVAAALSVPLIFFFKALDGYCSDKGAAVHRSHLSHEVSVRDAAHLSRAEWGQH